MEPAAESIAAIQVRWTPRRVRSTIVHAFVSFLLGVILTGIFAVAMLAGVVTLGGPKAISSPPHIAVACVLLGGLSFIMLRHAAERSCRKHPAGPLGIAIGLGVGCLVPLGVSIGNSSVPFVALTLTLAVAQPYAGYVGGMRGLSHRFSLTAVEGIGILCAHCGYDLSSTQHHWPCPECGGRMRHAGRDVE